MFTEILSKFVKPTVLNLSLHPLSQLTVLKGYIRGGQTFLISGQIYNKISTLGRKKLVKNFLGLLKNFKA
jgi:hypothetical protein